MWWKYTQIHTLTQERVKVRTKDTTYVHAAHVCFVFRHPSVLQLALPTSLQDVTGHLPTAGPRDLQYSLEWYMTFPDVHSCVCAVDSGNLGISACLVCYSKPHQHLHV